MEREGSVDEDLLEDSSNRIEEDLRARAIATPRRRYTRSADRQRAGDYLHRHQGSAVPGVVGRGLRQHVDSAGRHRRRAASERGRRRSRRAGWTPTCCAIEDLYHRRGFASAKATARRRAGAGRRHGVAGAGGRAHRHHRRRQHDGGGGDVRGQSGAQRRGAAACVRSRARPSCRSWSRSIATRSNSPTRISGYPSATVEVTPRFSPDGTRVTLVFTVREGPQVFVDHVLIVGNVRTHTETIERELQVKPGDPFSLAAINESQRRLTALGLFRRARITELRHGDETLRDLLVTIEEAPPTTVGYGGGLEGRLRVVPRVRRRRGVRAIRGRAAGLRRCRSPESVRQESIGEPLRERVPAPQGHAGDLGQLHDLLGRWLRPDRVPPRRHLPRASRVRTRRPMRS